jgi:hypothetical protein
MSITVECHSYVYGQTGVTARLFADGADISSGSFAAVAQSGRPGCYVFTTTLQGVFRVDLYSARPLPFWGGWINLGADPLAVAVDERSLISGEIEVDSLSANALLQEKNNLTGQVTVNRGPVGLDDDLDATELILTVGDDYAVDDARAIVLSLDGTSLPDLTAATVSIVLMTQKKYEFAGTVTVPTGATRSVQFALTAAQTMTLSPYVCGKFCVVLTTAEGHVITPEDGRGKLTVREGQTVCPAS